MTVQRCNPDSGTGGGTTRRADGTALSVAWTTSDVNIVIGTSTYRQGSAPSTRRGHALTLVTASGTFRAADARSIMASFQAYCLPVVAN